MRMHNNLTAFILLALLMAGCNSEDTAGNGAQAGPGSSVQDKQTRGKPPVPDGVCHDERPGQKNAYFGDLHVHTNFSFDAYFFNSINDPRDAYRFARGETLGLPEGTTDPHTPRNYVQLDRPLDFAAVTDHAEFLGAFKLACEADGTLDPESNLACEVVGQNIRDNVRNFLEGSTTPFQILVQTLLSPNPTERIAWTRTKSITDEANDPCRFTAMHGYEYSSNKRRQMFHRNVIFRGDSSQVPDEVFSSITPLSTVDDSNMNDEWKLFDHLQETCGGMEDCRVLTIPHNSNLSSGRHFLARNPDSGIPRGRDGEPLTLEDAQMRRKYDRALEIIQHKGQSECAVGLEGDYLVGEETSCDFEVARSVCGGRPGDPAICDRFCTGNPATDPNFCGHQYEPLTLTRVCEQTGPNGESSPNSCTTPLDMYRNAMAEGLAILPALGINPYRQGVIGSTDTHNAIMGRVNEADFDGHAGVIENTPATQLGLWDCDNSTRPISPEDPSDPDNCTNRVFLDRARNLNPGGLAGVWAPRNTREAVWDALHRGETFATSGPRMRVRMQASWEKPSPRVCQALASGGESFPAGGGAIMGGDLPAESRGESNGEGPYIATWAVQDPGGSQPGLPLQALDIIKGWTDAEGEPRVQVFEGVDRTRAPVHSPSRRDCSVITSGHPEQLCSVWQDPDFDPSQEAFYYARVREIPSCRWSAHQCVDAGVQCGALQPSNGMFAENSDWAGYEGCCVISGEPGSFRGVNHFHTLEERAWGSPVWYESP